MRDDRSRSSLAGARTRSIRDLMHNTIKFRKFNVLLWNSIILFVMGLCYPSQRLLLGSNFMQEEKQDKSKTAT